MLVCKNCGVEVPEGSAFCTECGAATEGNVMEVAQEENKTVETVKKAAKAAKKVNLSALFGVILGAVFILVGFIVMGGASDSLSYASFGADFYTYTYRGIREVADQVGKVASAMGWLLVAFGGFMECYFAGKVKK